MSDPRVKTVQGAAVSVEAEMDTVALCIGSEEAPYCVDSANGQFVFRFSRMHARQLVADLLYETAKLQTSAVNDCPVCEGVEGRPGKGSAK